MFKFGDWQIEIDEEKTREYYASLSLEDTQANRNFKRNIDFFTEKEKEFFDSICVDLNKLNIECGNLVVSTYLKRKRYWGCSADIFVWGKIISSPTIPIVTIDDVAEKGLEILEDRETGEIKVGRFKFEIHDPEEWEPGEDCPDGAIYISMDHAELDWLLDEKCEDIDTEDVSIFTKIKWELHSLFLGKIEEKRAQEKGIQDIIKCFENIGIEITPQEKKKVLSYKKQWVSNYTDDPEIAKNSLPSKKMHNLLWHVFSFEDNKAIEGEDAQKCFDSVKKESVTIYIDDFDRLFEADNIEGLTSENIENMCLDGDFYGNLDMIITAEDFSWTYCRTHESGWLGPYFYKK